MLRENQDYTDCEGQRCRHELARGVTVAELIGSDGPYPTIRFVTPAPRLRCRSDRPVTPTLVSA